MAISAGNQDKTRKYVVLANRLGSQIEAGVIKPGDRLPSLVDLRELYGASQPTAERAYALLEREGLIVRKPNRGVFVADWRQVRQQNVVGVALPANLYAHVYYERIVRGIQSVAREERVELLLLHDTSAIRWEKLDGVVLASPSRTMFEGLPAGMPAVSLLQPLRHGAGVVSDDQQAVRMLVEHLVGLGHRRIGFFTGGLIPFLESHVFYPNITGEHRLDGYYEAMHAAGIEPEAGWLRPFRDPSLPMKRFEELGREGMCQWLAEDWAELGLTALLANNDEMAVGIIEVMQQAGIRVPDDVSVVGFDGLDIADYFRPRLTTVEVPLEEIGAQGMRMLLEQVRTPLTALRNMPGGHSQPRRLDLPCRIKLGDSSGPPRTF